MATSIIVRIDKNDPQLNGRTRTREHCTVDARTVEQMNLRVGQQVLIRRVRSRLALFTIVATSQPEIAGSVVRVGEKGAERLGGGQDRGCGGLIVRAVIGAFSATLTDRFLSQSSRTERQKEARLVEDVVARGTDIAVLAPHGGEIEAPTDEQAIQVVTRLAREGRSVAGWVCRGYKEGGGAYDAWHITSTDIDPKSFPELEALFARRFEHAVSFHGFDEAVRRKDGATTTVPTVYVGGGAPDDVLGRFVDVIRTAVGLDVVVDRAPSKFAAKEVTNIVNAIAGGNGGIQIEQSKAARAGFAPAIANAVADVCLGL